MEARILSLGSFKLQLRLKANARLVAIHTLLMRLWIRMARGTFVGWLSMQPLCCRNHSIWLPANAGIYSSVYPLLTEHCKADSPTSIEVPPWLLSEEVVRNLPVLRQFGKHG